jgi:hypothetical protein
MPELTWTPSNVSESGLEVAGSKLGGDCAEAIASIEARMADGKCASIMMIVYGSEMGYAEDGE